MRKLRTWGILVAIGLASCTTVIPSGYDKCLNFTKLEAKNYPSISDIQGFLLGRFDGADVKVVQNGSSKGLEFGPYPFLSFMISHENNQVQAFKKAWVRPTYFGSKGGVIAFWDAAGGLPIHMVEIPEGLPDGTVRPVEFTAPTNIAIVGFGGEPSLVNAVCLDEETVAARGVKSASALAKGLRLE
jgi:hypothetical protein